MAKRLSKFDKLIAMLEDEIAVKQSLIEMVRAEQGTPKPKRQKATLSKDKTGAE